MEQRLVLAVLVCLPAIEGRLYRDWITVRTNVADRQWGGVYRNTGSNPGGFVLQVRSGNIQSITCGAAYYTPKIAISSASCMLPFRYETEYPSVVTMAYMDVGDSAYAPVELVLFPEEFKPGRTHMDVAVLRLSYPLKGFLTEFIGLQMRKIPEGDDVFAYGWGFENLDHRLPTDFTQVSTLTTVNQEDCAAHYPEKFLSNSTFCAWQPKKAKDCIFDGGTLLVWGIQLVGLASIGFSCKNTSAPAIFTSIRAVQNFIYKATHHKPDDDTE